MRLVFCPHGQSDKGYRTPLLAPYAFQDTVLIYGSLMLEMLRELGISVPSHAIIGNYRRAFYLKHRLFYDSLAAEELRLDRSKRTVLYAPTWKDSCRPALAQGQKARFAGRAGMAMTMCSCPGSCSTANRLPRCSALGN